MPSHICTCLVIIGKEKADVLETKTTKAALEGVEEAASETSV